MGGKTKEKKNVKIISLNVRGVFWGQKSLIINFKANLEKKNSWTTWIFFFIIKSGAREGARGGAIGREEVQKMYNQRNKNRHSIFLKKFVFTLWLKYPSGFEKQKLFIIFFSFCFKVGCNSLFAFSHHHEPSINRFFLLL